MSRPVVWSICASISATATIPVSRRARLGWRKGEALICCRMSGEALNRTQLAPSALTAIDDCVRAVARRVPARRPAQLGQLQFHCGKPPPAAEPRTRTSIIFLGWRDKFGVLHDTPKPYLAALDIDRCIHEHAVC